MPEKHSCREEDLVAGQAYLKAGKPQLALPLLKNAVKAGCVEALYQLAEMYRLGLGLEQNFALAIVFHEKANQAGFEASSACLSEMYRRSQGDCKESANKILQLCWQNLLADKPTSKCVRSILQTHAQSIMLDMLLEKYKIDKPEGKALLEKLVTYKHVIGDILSRNKTGDSRKFYEMLLHYRGQVKASSPRLFTVSESSQVKAEGKESQNRKSFVK